MAADRTNLLWGPAENLRSLIAASASFRTLVGAADAAAAAAHIYCPAIHAADLPSARPFALVMGPSEAAGRRDGFGAAYANGGELIFGLEAIVPEAHQGETTAQYAAAEKWFIALAGDILEEMLAAAADGTILDVRGYRLAEPPSRTDPVAVATEGDYYRMVLTVQWGMV